MTHTNEEKSRIIEMAGKIERRLRDYYIYAESASGHGASGLVNVELNI